MVLIHDKLSNIINSSVSRSCKQFYAPRFSIYENRKSNEFDKGKELYKVSPIKLTNETSFFPETKSCTSKYRDTRSIKQPDRIEATNESAVIICARLLGRRIRLSRNSHGPIRFNRRGTTTAGRVVPIIWLRDVDWPWEARSVWARWNIFASGTLFARWIIGPRKIGAQNVW